ncbi:MAG: hypothetical protein ACLP59_30600 [Bryobacteraceae bacterium]
MTQKSSWRGVLIAILSVALATQALADRPGFSVRPDLLAPSSGGGFQRTRDVFVTGVVVAAVAVAVVVIVLVTHRPQRITGCIHSGADGMGVTDEKDKRSYALSGNTAGIKAGFRMTLEGKRKHAGQAPAFEIHKVGRDFGACQT